jgi:hypothetical protein
MLVRALVCRSVFCQLWVRPCSNYLFTSKDACFVMYWAAAIARRRTHETTTPAATTRRLRRHVIGRAKAIQTGAAIPHGSPRPRHCRHMLPSILDVVRKSAPAPKKQIG